MAADALYPSEGCSLIHRIRLSWNISVVPQTRHEIASILSIIGLIFSLISSAGIVSLTSWNQFSLAIIAGCTAIGVLPLPFVILCLTIGLIILACGISLFPAPRTSFHL